MLATDLLNFEGLNLNHDEVDSKILECRGMRAIGGVCILGTLAR